jgi:hypothetical protein
VKASPLNERNEVSMSNRKMMPPQDPEPATSRPQPFVSISRRREILSNLAERAARTTPLVLPEAIAGISPVPTCTDDQAVPNRGEESGKARNDP